MTALLRDRLTGATAPPGTAAAGPPDSAGGAGTAGDPGAVRAAGTAPGPGAARRTGHPAGVPAAQASASRVDGPSDEVLARRAALGDRDAFGELVARHAPAMTRYAVRMTGRRQDAEDAVQEALLSAWRGVAGFRGDAAVRTWLFRLVGSKVVDAGRRRREVLLDAAAVDRPTPAGTGPEDHARRADLLADLQRALDRLPATQRSVWLLREVEQLGYAEIGQVAGMPASTVRGQLARARHTLARELASWR